MPRLCSRTRTADPGRLRLKLLFDQNLSPRLPNRLADLFPGSNHVSLLGLAEASDEEVRDHARVHGYAVVTKDADFGDLSVLRGFPPKIVWLRLGNCTTSDIERTLRNNRTAIAAMDTDPDAGILTLY